MSTSISPLAPKHPPELKPIAGVRLGGVEAGIKYQNRRDLAAILFDQPAAVAGVFTRSRCPSAPVDWCRRQISSGIANCLIVNSGNANAFTGKKGSEAVELTAEAAAKVFGHPKHTVFLASTGVIGEPLDASGFQSHLGQLKSEVREDGWLECAQTIMTTDTYPKLASAEFVENGTPYRVNGIVKGSGMIAPDMATMLGFIVTDYPVTAALLQPILSKAVDLSFNAITVDSDTSTSDSVLAFSTCPQNCSANGIDDPQLSGFRSAIEQVCHALAMLVVRDGEGATKHVEITVTGAQSDKSAKTIAMAIANSPLVKTAIAGCDANWGRIVMAVGKAGEPADRDRLKIRFGSVEVARNGERVPDYSEESAAQVMRQEHIPIAVDLGLGTGKSTVWTCDLTKEYVAINGDYRS